MEYQKSTLKDQIEKVDNTEQKHLQKKEKINTVRIPLLETYNKKLKSVHQGHVLSQLNAPAIFSILITLIISKSIFSD